MKRRTRAFTLLELLVVVAILGILGALAAGAVGRALDHGKMSASMNNLRQLVTANQAYAADHGHYAPATNGKNDMRWSGAYDSARGAFDPTRGYLSDYLGKSRRVTLCPLFKDMLTGAASFEASTGGYGYNDVYIGGTPGRVVQPTRDPIPAVPGRIQRAQTVMFTTTAYASCDAVQEYPLSHPPFWDFGSGPTGRRPSPSTHFRFHGKALVAWCDGRVTAEECDPREVGYNPHGGDAQAHKLGWFGPDENNGFWNPAR